MDDRKRTTLFAVAATTAVVFTLTFILTFFGGGELLIDCDNPSNFSTTAKITKEGVIHLINTLISNNFTSCEKMIEKIEYIIFLLNQ